MGDIVNLRTARKRKARAGKAADAAARRAEFGEPKAARETRRLMTDKDAARHDSHKREP